MGEGSPYPPPPPQGGELLAPGSLISTHCGRQSQMQMVLMCLKWFPPSLQ